MNRRDSVLAMLALGATPFATRAAPPGRVYRIGFLRQGGEPPKTWAAAFQQGLRDYGYIDGQNAVVDYRFSIDATPKEISRVAVELASSRVDVILASSTAAAVAAKDATTVLPIVFAGVSDPVELGIVKSLARPGGNITGLCVISADLAGKRLQIFREIIPKLKRVAVLWHPENPSQPGQLKGAEIAARTLGMQLKPLPVHGMRDYESAFRDARSVGALLIPEGAMFTNHRRELSELAAKFRVPTMYGLDNHVRAGGLISYGADFIDIYRRVGMYIDKILKGAKPADLPVEQPTKFELLVDLNAAKGLGLTIPQSVLARADEVIQ